MQNSLIDPQTMKKTGLKISHVVSGIAMEAAGPSYTVPAMALSQGQAGHDVTLHSLGAPVAPTDAPWQDLRYERDKTAIPALQKLGKSRALRAALEAGNSDILHAHGLWQMPLIYAAQAAQRSGKPLTVAPRGMLSPTAMQVSRGRKKLFALACQNKALDCVSMFHATAISEYEEIRNHGLGQPVTIIPNGIDVRPARTLDRNRQTRTVLSLGRLHPHKGLNLLIRAWAQIEKAHPEWQLQVIGPDQVGHKAELQKLTDALNLKRVKVSEPVFGSEKWDTYAQADLFVLPSRSENFAVSVTEALAASVPVISSKGAPWAGLQTHGCGWWIDLEVSELAAALNNAMHLDDAARENMGARGRAWMMRDFSWPAIADDMIASYRWLLEGGPPPPQVRLD